MSDPIRLMIVDDHPVVRNGLTGMFAAEAEFAVVGEATVKTHLMHIYAKLGVNDRAAAVATGYDRGLLIPRGTG